MECDGIFLKGTEKYRQNGFACQWDKGNGMGAPTSVEGIDSSASPIGRGNRNNAPPDVRDYVFLISNATLIAAAPPSIVTFPVLMMMS
jgi:hypothetical protein